MKKEFSVQSSAWFSLRCKSRLSLNSKFILWIAATRKGRLLCCPYSFTYLLHSVKSVPSLVTRYIEYEREGRETWRSSAVAWRHANSQPRLFVVERGALYLFEAAC